MQKLFLAVTAYGAVRAEESTGNPLAKVIELMDDCTAKVQADGEAEAKAYKEYFEWCDDVDKNTRNEIKTSKAQKEKLTSSIEKAISTIEVSTTKVEELAESISADEKELEGATKVRKEERATFEKAEGELVDGVDTLDRAVGILEREMEKGGAALAQVDTSNMQKVVAALGTVMDAASFDSVDRTKLMALVQAGSDDDDSDSGAPAPDAYKSKSGGIVDVLVDMKEKAEGELSELRKEEGTKQQNYEMLKQSLEGEIDANNKDLDEQKSMKSAAEESKATDEGDLEITKKDLAESTKKLQETHSGCLQGAADHETNIEARTEELKVIAEAKKILQEVAAGGAASFLQESSSNRMMSVTNMVKKLAKRHHSSALSQLASRIGVVMQYGGASQDVFAKVKGLINDMIAKLEKEAEEDAAEKAYCDEEMSKTEAKKTELEDDIEKLSTKIDENAAKSTKLKGEVTELQASLAKMAKEQEEMDTTRRDQNSAYRQAKEDLEKGLAGVQKALEVLRDYYGGAAFIQTFNGQPAPPQKAQKQSGAGGGIIDILEVCESDFSSSLAKEEAAEADSQEEYDTLTQENKVAKAQQDQDVKFKTAEFKQLDTSLTELASDRSSVEEELEAVMEYYGKVKDKCVAKPESYEERTKRRAQEIEGLKQALSILESETALVQRKRRSFRGHM
jgi:DNA repair exonuclease SbcCD ATPase subunit